MAILNSRTTLVLHPNFRLASENFVAHDFAVLVVTLEILGVALRLNGNVPNLASGFRTVT